MPRAAQRNNRVLSFHHATTWFFTWFRSTSIRFDPSRGYSSLRSIYLSISLSIYIYMYIIVYIYISIGIDIIPFSLEDHQWDSTVYFLPGWISGGAQGTQPQAKLPDFYVGNSIDSSCGRCTFFFRVLGRAIAKKSVWYFFKMRFISVFFPSRSFWYILDIFPHVMFFPHVFPYVFPSFSSKIHQFHVEVPAISASPGGRWSGHRWTGGAQLSARDTALQLQQGRDTW